MKTVKVSVQDENTLVLLEDAKKGDIIDLRSIHDVDIDKAPLENLVKSVRTREFDSQLELARKQIEKEKELQIELSKKELTAWAKDELRKKDQQIITLNTKMEGISNQLKAESRASLLEEKQKIEEDFREKLTDKDKEIQEIKHQKEMSEQRLKDDLKASETALISYKEMRTKMSTKMIGESLETHCENEFNRLRGVAFPNAVFNKDNTVSSSGSKGDYIYREYDDAGTEILSIMFEMKNEDDASVNKQKNQKFFRELDKDRQEKKCEYAVLVSLLEKDNEYYDDIVMVPDYPLMYVVRPQHFITIIGLLRQGSLKSLQLQRTIDELKNRNIDVNNFEEKMNAFKESFARNYDLASRNFYDAITEIDRTIDHLNKVKDKLLKSENNYRLANNKASDLTIKKLTANSPSVAKAFDNLAKSQD